MKHGLTKKINLYKKRLRVISLASLGTKCQLKLLGLGVHSGLFPGIEVPNINVLFYAVWSCQPSDIPWQNSPEQNCSLNE